jgi:hypothetical protein
MDPQHAFVTKGISARTLDRFIILGLFIGAIHSRGLGIFPSASEKFQPSVKRKLWVLVAGDIHFRTSRFLAKNIERDRASSSS